MRMTVSRSSSPFSSRLSLPVAGYAFHSGGVAECDGCHSMHSPQAGGSFLLVGTDQSSTCLSCHEHAGDTGPSSYHVSHGVDATCRTGMPPLQRTPGGDFGWLKKTYTLTVRGTADTEDGATHGHNIVAADFGYVVGHRQRDGSRRHVLVHAARLQELPRSARPEPPRLMAATERPSRTAGMRRSSPPARTTTAPSRRADRGRRRVPPPPRASATSTRRRHVRRRRRSPWLRPPTTGPRRRPRPAWPTAPITGPDTWGNWCATCHPDMHSSRQRYVHPVDQAARVRRSPTSTTRT